VKFSTLAIGTNALNHTVPAGIFSTARTVVITTRARTKLVPAFFAQIFVGFTNTLTAVDADRRPKQVIGALHKKRENLSQSGRIHACII
jgi:hypothetical protein